MKTEEFKEGKFLVVRRDGTAPHWPYFVLGARDPWAEEALRFYAECIYRDGGDPDHAESIDALADDFAAYRSAEGKGDPEAPPHRKDSPDVLHVMRGGVGVIRVIPDLARRLEEGKSMDTFYEALNRLIVEWRETGTSVDEIISDLELTKMALEEDLPEVDE